MIQTTPSMTAPVRLQADELVETPSELRRALRSLLKARWPLLALIVLGIVGFFALFGPNIAPKDPNRQTLRARLTPPTFVAETPNPDYPLGSDALGA